MKELPFESLDGKIVRVDVRGDSNQLWAKLRGKLIESIERLLDSTLDHSRGTTFRDEAKQFTTAMLDYAKAKLAMPVVEVQKITAEIAKIYAERQRELADADKMYAEADVIRQRKMIKDLYLSLGAAKAMLIGETSEESLLLGKRIEAFLEVVRELSASE